MSDKRKWTAKWSMGFCGTDSEEEIDLIDDWGWSEEHLAGETDENIEQEVSEYAHQCAMEMVDAYAEPVE